MHMQTPSKNRKSVTYNAKGTRLRQCTAPCSLQILACSSSKLRAVASR